MIVATGYPQWGDRTGSRRQNTHQQLWINPNSYVRNLTDATETQAATVVPSGGSLREFFAGKWPLNQTVARLFEV